MMPVLKREPLRPHGDGARRSMGSSTGFTLVEVVVSSSILAFALAGSFRGWSQGQALVQQANQRQVLLDAIEQDLQRQQGLVIQTLKTTLPWACEVSLADLRSTLQALSHDLPDVVERQWPVESQPSGLAIRYTVPKLKAPRQRLLALRGGPVCDQAMAAPTTAGEKDAAG